MGFDNVCLQRRDLRGLAMHHCDTDSNAWFHCMPFEVDLWQESNGEKNGTSTVRCWDVGPRRTACACVCHHQLYITGIPLAYVLKMYVWVIPLIPQHWIISWQFLLHGVFFSTTLSFWYIRMEKSCRFTREQEEPFANWIFVFYIRQEKPTDY